MGPDGNIIEIIIQIVMSSWEELKYFSMVTSEKHWIWVQQQHLPACVSTWKVSIVSLVKVRGLQSCVA